MNGMEWMVGMDWLEWNGWNGLFGMDCLEWNEWLAAVAIWMEGNLESATFHDEGGGGGSGLGAAVN